jgi:hypothetical protein
MTAEEGNHPDVIIATVGQQPMPVLIPLVQYGPVHGQLIATAEVQDIAGYIRTAARQIDRQPRLPRPGVLDPVYAFSVEDTYDACRRAASYYEKRVINITGGTTLMGMGAQKAAVELGAPMLYVDTDHACIIHFSHAGQEQGQEPIDVDISVPVYLAAHGASVRPKDEWGASVREDGDGGWVQPFITLARRMAERATDTTALMDEVRGVISRKEHTGQLDGVGEAEFDLAQHLAGQGLLADLQRDGDALTFRVADRPRARKFLSGTWLELYVYDACRQSDRFDDVWLSARVKRRVQRDEVLNELDVIVTHNGRLAAISCKTTREEVVEKDENKAAVYELDSLLQAELMGLYARKVLVSNRYNLPPALRTRAELSRTEVIDGPRLRDVARIVYDHLRS